MCHEAIVASTGTALNASWLRKKINERVEKRDPFRKEVPVTDSQRVYVQRQRRANTQKEKAIISISIQFLGVFILAFHVCVFALRCSLTSDSVDSTVLKSIS